MKNKTLFRWVFVSILTIILSTGCGPGQLLGPTLTPQPTETAIPTPTSIPSPNGILSIPLTGPITLVNGNLTITIVQATTEFLDIDNALVLGVIVQVTGDKTVLFARCDALSSLSSSVSADGLELIKSIYGAQGCLTLDEEQDLVAYAPVPLDSGVLSQEPGDLEGQYKKAVDPDTEMVSLLSLFPGEPEGYYLVFSAPKDVTDIKLRLEFKLW